MLLLFFFNVFLAFLWIILFQSSSLIDFVVGFLVSFGLLSILERRYGRTGLYALGFLMNVLWQVIVSSVEVAWVLIQPRLKIAPGIVAIPLDVTQDFQIATLASAITLTPGTLSVDVGRDTETGGQVLFVHTLFTDDPEGLRRRIKGGFERYILEITEGGRRVKETN
jgi:multicomponent Na+:H+ antiporter subunit E